VDIPEPVVEEVSLTPIPLIEPIHILEASPVPLFAELMPLAVTAKKTNGHNGNGHHTDVGAVVKKTNGHNGNGHHADATPVATTPVAATTLYDLMGVGGASEEAPTRTRRPRHPTPNREMSPELESRTLVTQNVLW
jgi:hypothetical protein